MKLIWVILLFNIFYFISCTSEDQSDREEIIEYLIRNRINARDTLGIFIFISEEGALEKPNSESTIDLSYTAKYLDGETFDKTPAGTIIKLKVKDAIPGLAEGLLFFGRDGKGTIYLPSEKGYGANPPFGVRKDAILVYDITVLDF